MREEGLVSTVCVVYLQPWCIRSLYSLLWSVNYKARTMYDLMLTVIILSCSVMQCSMDTLKFVCSWHGRIPWARLSVKVLFMNYQLV